MDQKRIVWKIFCLPEAHKLEDSDEFPLLFIALINLSQNYRKEAQQIDQEISERLFSRSSIY